ncbi:gamma-glutamyltransferase [Burkholderiaceae bacterium FT117]|uniref:gamma-glutamyltransferase n=1 Tax=Zeimonas sediminis TaxID=2944268 RepID=UPI0023430A0D|nr:gamma-glutamyltransferase [Zeimonas sediminis]MCM5570401.1 gamma-glutamyltransferase [Zeimonas sediminis]
MSGLPFECEKRPATGTRGMVVTNHPLASAAGAEMLAAGGNAIDAAVAALFTLSVVEPMMVGIFGGGLSHIRLADGRHTVVDGLSCAPSAARPDTYRPVSDRMPDYMETEGRENAVGATSVAVPGNLLGWCEAASRHGRLPLADLLEPAIRHARRGFRITEYLSGCIAECAPDLAADAEIARLFLPNGRPLAAGERLVSGDYAETLAAIAAQGPAALHGGELGRHAVDALAARGGLLSLDDLAGFRLVDRAPVRGSYRGHEIIGPPPPSAGGVHVLQMLNILEGFDLRGMGFGSAESMHLLAEVLKIAFADRAAATADPAFVSVPVERLVSKEYAGQRRAAIDTRQASEWLPGVALPRESANTTHVSVADRDGNIVASTQTINSLFGARIMIPGTGIIPNNYMYLFDPHPGKALSVAPGKRVTTSTAPTIVLRDGRPRYVLGLPGGLRIFGSVMQALVNLIDHGMTMQQAVEAPRLWTQGQELEVEQGLPEAGRAALRGMGHRLAVVPHVAGGMNGIEFADDGSMTGAACWRADGTAIGLGGGLARPNTRFWPEAPRAT